MQPWCHLIAVGVILGLALPAHGQTLTGADTDAILDAAKMLGVASLHEQPNGDPLINGVAGKVAYQIYFKNCTANADCEDLNFYAGFAQTQPTLELINAWNRDKRFARAYLDEDGDAAVEMDLDLVQGVSAGYLAAQFSLWPQVLTEFTDHIGFN